MAFLEARDRRDRVAEWVDRNAGKVFILPAVLTLLAFSLFPLLVSAYLTLTKLKFAAGGFKLRYVEWLNFKKLIFGSQQYHLLGTFDVFGVVDWLILGAIFAFLLYVYVRYLTRPGVTAVGVIGRSVAYVVAGALALLLVATLGGGFPGSLVVTIFYVVAGVSVQFGLALGLAVLCSQKIYGRNLFRVVFFLPVHGDASRHRLHVPHARRHPQGAVRRYLGRARARGFRLGVGPVDRADRGADRRHLAVDALHVHRPAGRHREPAARPAGGCPHRRCRRLADVPRHHLAGDRAGGRDHRAHPPDRGLQDHRSANVLTSGGPGIATESLTLHAFVAWRTQDLGGSAAVGYMLLFVATVTCLSFFNFAGRRTRRTEL